MLSRHKMSTQRRLADPAFVLLIVLLSSQIAIVLTHYRHPLISDEVYYTAKARYLSEHHRFAPADPRAIAVERGLAWGNSDWRPPGYAIFVSALSGGDFSDPAGALRWRVTVAQLCMVAAALIALYFAATGGGAPRYATAILLGAPPWVFFAVNEIGPDPENLAIVTAALLLFWRFIVASKNHMRWLAAATAMASLALFFRPEMILFPPLLAGIAVLLRMRIARIEWRQAVVAALIFCTFVGMQVTYHTWFSGRLGVFGGLHIYNRGAFDWANSWLGTEKETYDFVYSIGEGRAMTLPDRAFDSAVERDAVRAIVTRIGARGVYTAADDTEFERLAQIKAREHPMRMLLLRGWHTIHLWLNVENNGPLLNALAAVPRAVRRPIYGASLLLRVAALCLAAVALVRSVRSFRRGMEDAWTLLVLLMLAYVVMRSLLTGVILNWNVHRYVLSAWPPLLCCASLALRPRARA